MHPLPSPGPYTVPSSFSKHLLMHVLNHLPPNRSTKVTLQKANLPLVSWSWLLFV